MYGGHITDYFDRRVTMAYLEVSYRVIFVVGWLDSSKVGTRQWILQTMDVDIRVSRGGAMWAHSKRGEALHMYIGQLSFYERNVA